MADWPENNQNSSGDSTKLADIERERDALKARLEAVIAAVNIYAQKQHAGEYWETCANDDCEALARALKGDTDA